MENASSYQLKWVSAVRLQLTKLYGKDHPELSKFAPIRSDVQKGAVPQIFRSRLVQLDRILDNLEAAVSTSIAPLRGNRIFIGHGHSPLWREFKDFIHERLWLPYDEFNRDAVAGHHTVARLEEMLAQAAFAFLIMTAEEEHADSKVYARPNVIHETGLFQGHLGFTRAIVMLEEGCEEYSNIHGLVQIRFPPGDIAAKFEEVRRVLEKAGLVPPVRRVA
jgi:predicted nucleotide-binding protein